MSSFPAFFETGDHELLEEHTGGGRIGEVDGGIRHEDVGAKHAYEPVAGTGGRGGREPGREGGRDGVADGHQHAVAGAEGEMSEDGLGLVREQELQRVMAHELRGGGGGDATTASASVDSA